MSFFQIGPYPKYRKFELSKFCEIVQAKASRQVAELSKSFQADKSELIEATTSIFNVGYIGNDKVSLLRENAFG